MLFNIFARKIVVWTECIYITFTYDNSLLIIIWYLSTKLKPSDFSGGNINLWVPTNSRTAKLRLEISSPQKMNF